MHKRKQWIVAAGLALCGLLLAALTLGRPRDVPETSRDSAPWPVVRVVPAWNGFPGGKKRVLTRLGENAIYLKIAHKISQMQKNGHFD